MPRKALCPPTHQKCPGPQAEATTLSQASLDPSGARDASAWERHKLDQLPPPTGAPPFLTRGTGGGRGGCCLEPEPRGLLGGRAEATAGGGQGWAL